MHIRDLINKYGSDLSNLHLNDFADVDFTGLYKDVSVTQSCRLDRLPNEPELFQVIKDKSLHLSYIPEGDYSAFNFSDVYLKSCLFDIGAMLPNNRDLFQKVRGKSLIDTVLPEMDYSNFDFSGVKVYTTVFVGNSVLPITFFQEIETR